jgi:hypothetical protein
MQTTTTVSFHQYEQPTCNTPDAVHGRLISELSPSDFKDVPLQSRINSNVQQSTETEVSEQPSSSVSRNMAPQSHDTDTPQNNGNNAQSSRQPSSTGGVRVIIKPPRNQQTSNPSKVSADKKQKMTKAERKAERRAERERKRKMKEERRRQRRLSQKDKDAKRKKRRIHKKKGQRCKVDKDGNMKCVRRKRCKVDDQGNVVCRKRKGKKDKQKQ